MKGFCRSLTVLPLLYLTVWMIGCTQGVHNPSVRPGLCFSADTISFDTVFSSVGSTTAWLTVFNPHGEAVRVDSVFLRSHGTSGFRISVDALPGNGCGGLEIPPGDSVFVFVELTAPVSHSSIPVLLTDGIVFRQGGSSQEVFLKACSQDAVIWKGRVLTADTALTSGIPFLVYDSLVVSEGVRVDIGEGTAFHFHDGAMLYNYGTVSAVGTVERPVVFRGDRLDKVSDDFPYEYYPGQWEGIYLAPQSSGNLFQHVSIRGANYGIIADSTLDASEVKLKLYDSEVFNVVHNALYNFSSTVEVHNSLLANAGSYVVLLIGGRTELVHCTLANYQTLVVRAEKSPALAAVNFTGNPADGSVTPYPLDGVSVVNSVIYGTQNDEVGYGRVEKVPFNLSFHHCLLRQELPLDTAFTDSVWYNEDPLFLSTGKGYVYDFHPDTLSAVTARADTLVSRDYPFDLDGNVRIVEGKADLGAFRVHF